MTRTFTNSAVTQQAAIVYGLYDLTGICLYVGLSRYPLCRKQQHRKAMPLAIFKVLRVTNSRHGQNIESQVIHSYWKRSQAQHNRRALCGSDFDRQQTICCHSPQFNPKAKTQ